MIRSKLLTAVGGGGGDIYIGEKEFNAPGFYYWSVPLSVTKIHVCCIGAGGYNDYALTTSYNGGGGGGLAWTNDIDVTPGSELLIRVGTPSVTGDGRHSTIGVPKENVQEFDEIYIEARGGSAGTGGDFDLRGRAGGGGRGGDGSQERIIQNNGVEVWGGAGGGAGGYQGNGGKGIVGRAGAITNPGQGGGGAGGVTWWRALTGTNSGFNQGSAGGGTGVKGIGASGSGQPVQGDGQEPVRGLPGSNGTGADFGAGGAALYNMSPSVAPEYAKPGGGAVRIIWGIKYSYPNNADVSA